MMITKTHQMLERRRGSALVLVVLLTLILSAIAIVALRDVARTTRGSAVYRTRAQAQLTSDSADRMFVAFVGDRAPTLIHAIQEGAYGEEDDGATYQGVYGGREDEGLDLDGSGDVDLGERRRALAVRGVDLEFTSEDLADNCGGGCTPVLTHADPTGEESGLFRFNNADTTFESRRKVEWRVRLRDLVDGFPAEGYSGQFCFKKALIAAEARVGESDPDWSRANNVATGRHGIDAMIGPVECGYNR